MMARSSPVPGLLLAGLCAGAAACGGGSGSGGGSAQIGIAPPVRLSVVPPLGAPGATEAPGIPPEADYHQDAVVVTVRDAADASLARANRLLSILARAGTLELVNEGVYLAQIDAVPGASLRDALAASRPRDRSYAAARAGLLLLAAEGEHPDGRSAHELRTWWDEEDPELGPVSYELAASLRTPPDEHNPFGVFELHFAAGDPGGSGLEPLRFGSLQASRVAGAARLAYFERTGDLLAVPAAGERAEEIQAVLETAPGGGSGLARLFRRTRADDGASGDTGVVPEQLLASFDGEYYLRARNGLEEVAFGREPARESAVRYRLYHASGEEAGMRVRRRRGVGFQTDSGAYGWADRFGIWTPPGVAVAHGELVTRAVFGEPGSAAVYEVVRSTGRLLRHRHRSLALEEIEGRVFERIHAVGGAVRTSRVVFAAGAWTRTAEVDPATGLFAALEPPAPIDVAAPGYLHLWSDELGGPVSYVHGDGFVSWSEQSVVDLSDELFASGAASVELVAFVDAPRSGITPEEARTGQVFLPVAPPGAPHRYAFTRDDLTLHRDPTGDGSALEPVGLAEPTVPEGPYAWGMRSGPLLPLGAVPASPEAAWNEEEFFTYETGPHPWNGHAGLVDAAGDAMRFDPPLELLYRHAAEQDRNADAAYDGRLVLLRFGGGDELRGIPLVAHDADGDGIPDRSHPAFDLLDGTLLGAAGEYLVKAVDVELVLTPDPSGLNTSSMVPASDLVLPDASAHVMPDLGPAPPPGAPRVIDGVVLEASDDPAP